MKTTAQGTDLDRFRPSPTQLRTAAAILRANRDTDAVLVPIALPGKHWGFWMDGQPVEHPDGFWLAGVTDGGYAAARDAASAAADAHLGERDGTPAYAAIRPGGHWAVFEDIRPGRATGRAVQP